MRMQHRHLELPEGVYSVAAVHSVLERGGASDLLDLLRAIRQDPFGDAAEAAIKAASRSDVYGYSAVLLAYVEAWRAEAGSPLKPTI